MEISFAIGGAITSGLLTATARANKQFSALGRVGEDLKKRFSLIEGIEENQKKIQNLSLKLKEAQGKASHLHRQLIDGSSRSTEEQEKLSLSAAKAAEKAHKLNDNIKSLVETNKRYVNEVRKSSGSVASLRAEKQRLGVTIERLNAIQQKSIDIERRKSNLQNIRSDARGRMMDAMALAYVARKPINAMVEGEQSQFRLSTVINVPEQFKKEGVRRAWEVGKEMARSGLTGLNEGMNIQYALNSAGLDAALARSATPVVAGVAKLTGGAEEEVGEILATAYNNLGKQVTGTEAEKFSRLADLATKTQYKFQIRNFGQFGETLKNASPSIATFNVQLEQAYTAAGMLNSAGLQSGTAGTAFNAMLRGLSKGCKEYQPQIVRAKDGTMDLVATLRKIKSDTRFMTTDERAQFLQTLFGDEGLKGVVPLLDKVDEFAEATKDVAEGSKGIVDKGVAEYLQTNKAKIDRMTGSLSILAYSLGGAFAPAVEQGAKVLAAMGDKVTWFTEKYPKATKYIGSFLAGVVAMKVSGAGLKYFFGIFGGGYTNVLAAANNIGRFRLALGGADVGAGPLMKSCLKLWKLFGWLKVGAAKAVTSLVGFVATNPVLFGVIAAVAVLGVIAWKIYKNWDAVKTFFVDMWNAFEARFPQVAAIIKGAIEIILIPLKKLWEGLKAAWEWGKKLLGLDTEGAGHATGAVAAKGKGSRVTKHERARKQAVTPLAAGGFVTSPTLALVGEDGDELVLPLQNRSRTLELLSRAGIFSFGATSGAIGEPVKLNVTNHITIQGNADEAAVNRALARSEKDLERMLARMMNDKRRVSFA